VWFNAIRSGNEELQMNAGNHKRSILTYPIASGENCYAVANERTVNLKGDPEAGFSLYGQIPDGGDASSVSLAEALLEFAMTWNTPGDPSEARRQMQIFGKHLGEALADQRARAKPVHGALGRVGDALEDVFRSLGAAFAYCQNDGEVRYQLDPWPLQVTAEATGMRREAELAHQALIAICQSLVGALAPELSIRLPSGPDIEQVISIVAATSNGR
jgi:hypothetical protein